MDRDTVGACVSAAFFRAGLEKAGLAEVLEAWGESALSLTYELVKHAPLASSLFAAGTVHPGVFDYEVSVPFGIWFGEQVKQTGNAPSHDSAEYELRWMSNLFFNQNDQPQGAVNMEKITGMAQLVEHYGYAAVQRATQALELRGIRTDNIVSGDFWIVREQIRFDLDEYTRVNILGDDPLRFAHYSLAGDGRIAYTKNASKGAADLQTCTTLKEYCDMFELSPDVTPVNSTEYQALEARYAVLFDDYAVLLRKHTAIVNALTDHQDLKARMTEAESVLDDLL